MLRSRMLRWMSLAAFGTVVMLALGSLAWGYDDDDYYRHDEAREHGYQNGFRDGLHAGQYDLDRGRRFNFKSDDWEDAHGFEHWMGNHGHYKQASREGYERGYRRAYGSDRDRRGYHRDRCQFWVAQRFQRCDTAISWWRLL